MDGNSDIQPFMHQLIRFSVLIGSLYGTRFFFFVPYLRNVYRVHLTCSITLLSVLSFPCNYVMSMSMGLKNSGYLKGVFSVSIVSFFEDYLTHSVSQYLTVFICYVYRFWFNFCYNSYCQFSLDLLFCVEWSGEM